MKQLHRYSAGYILPAWFPAFLICCLGAGVNTGMWLSYSFQTGHDILGAIATIFFLLFALWFGEGALTAWERRKK